jgi:hypothetical protein
MRQKTKGFPTAIDIQHPVPFLLQLDLSLIAATPIPAPHHPPNITEFVARYFSMFYGCA